MRLSIEESAALIVPAHNNKRVTRPLHTHALSLFLFLSRLGNATTDVNDRRERPPFQECGVDARCNLSRDAPLPSSYTVDVKREQANVCVCVCVRILTRVVLET